MRNCAWMILRGASDASTESATVGPFAPQTENDDNRQIARQKKFLTPQLGPIHHPDCRVVPLQCKQNSTLIYQSAGPVRRAVGRALGARSPAIIPTCPRAENLLPSKVSTAAARAPRSRS